MPKSLRVKQPPTPLPVSVDGETDRVNIVTGIAIALETRGNGSTQATFKPQPAALVLKLATLKRVRTEGTGLKA
jgi:hypothetical protein